MEMTASAPQAAANRPYSAACSAFGAVAQAMTGRRPATTSQVTSTMSLRSFSLSVSNSLTITGTQMLAAPASRMNSISRRSAGTSMASVSSKGVMGIALDPLARSKSLGMVFSPSFSCRSQRDIP